MADLFAKRCVTGARCHVSSNGDPVGPVLRFPRFLVSGDTLHGDPPRGFGAYAAAKAALDSLTRSVAVVSAARDTVIPKQSGASHIPMHEGTRSNPHPGDYRATMA